MTSNNSPDIINDRTTISLTATIDGNGQVTGLMDGSDPISDGLEDDNLPTSATVTLSITASDNATSIFGTYTISGSSTSFSANGAVTISQDFPAPSDSNGETDIEIDVSTSQDSSGFDPMLILKTLPGGWRLRRQGA